MNIYIRNLKTSYKYLDILRYYGIKVYLNVLKQVLI